MWVAEEAVGMKAKNGAQQWGHDTSTIPLCAWLTKRYWSRKHCSANNSLFTHHREAPLQQALNSLHQLMLMASMSLKLSMIRAAVPTLNRSSETLTEWISGVRKASRRRRSVRYKTATLVWRLSYDWTYREGSRWQKASNNSLLKFISTN